MTFGTPADGHLSTGVRDGRKVLQPGGTLAGEDLARARAAFLTDLGALSIIELDADTCQTAASIAEASAVRTLDALHLAAAQRVAEPGMRFLTFDLRQSQAARALGLEVVPA